MTSSEFQFAFNIAILGDKNVGKSALLEYELFKKPLTNISTDNLVGIQCRTKYYPTQLDLRSEAESLMRPGFKTEYNVKITYWDVPGDEDFMDTSCRLIAGCAGIIFVFDVNNSATLEDIELWLSEAEKKRSIAHILVGNKADMNCPREVSFEFGEHFAKSFGLDYYETSAITGLQVESAFSCMREIITDQLNISLQTLAMTYHRLKSITIGPSLARKLALMPGSRRRASTVRITGVSDVTDWIDAEEMQLFDD